MKQLYFDDLKVNAVFTIKLHSGPVACKKISTSFDRFNAELMRNGTQIALGRATPVVVEP